MAEKYNASNIALEQVLNFIKSGEIAIPEIQRPFVWKAKQVRDLIDSLYTGYPTGYLIISQSPNVRLKNGKMSEGEKLMIDGQQRVTALMTAIMGIEVIDADFKKKRIKISFNPLANEENEEERFKVQDNSTLRDKRWIADIADMFKPTFDLWNFVMEYCVANEGVSGSDLNRTLMQLIDIKNRQMGLITLDKDLTIDEVTEIFIRINSRGAKLNQADFAMSKIAANTKYGGDKLRKAIDYFSHLAVAPDWYSEMSKDEAFMATTYAPKLKWLAKDNESIFDPDYNDILRIAFMYKFGRAKMKDLVSLLGGRDFETREYKEEIAEESFSLLSEGVIDFMNEYSFSNFVQAIKSAGFISNKLINSQITLDFAYTLYLILNADKNIEKTNIKHYISRWYVMSVITSRYISSPESAMDLDIRRIAERGFVTYLEELEAATLSESFWSIGLVQNLETSSIGSPYFNTFIASQVRGGDNSLFMNGSKISDLITIIGDVHHIFPKKYLIRNGISDKSKYNQIANYTYLDSPLNKLISDDAPDLYFSKAMELCSCGKQIYGNINNIDALRFNLSENCIPAGIETMSGAEDYERFLTERRKLMAQKIKAYYYSL
ncbi:MAG: DUF262 domain-containing protein [Rikenellaceae bacterium]